MTLGSIDYATSYFKYKTPTPIQGPPSNKTLKRLKTELRANASSVECELGGGDHGYLGLVLNNEEYASITPAPLPFNPPNFPDPLVIDPDTNQVTALTRREQWQEDKKRYYECKNVEKALQRHIQDAIEDKYLASLVNEDTGLIHEDIPTVLAFLFEAYGIVPSEEVKQKETDIRTMQFHPLDPMITLFNPVEQLKKMAISAKIPYTANQLLDIGLTVLRNTRDFERALGDWTLKTDAEKTWNHFKAHFTTGQAQLKAIRGPTMQQAGYHHAHLLANTLRNDFRTDLDTHSTDLLTLLQTAMETQSNTTPGQASTTMSTLTPGTHQVHATTTDTIQLQILHTLQKLQEGLQGTKASTSASAPSAARRKPRKTPDNATFARRQTDTYCWTHGGCSHPSPDCQAKVNGHQDAATFENKMGGSKAYCS